MIHFLAALPFLILRTLGDSQAARRSADLDPSAKQIRDTLQNLLKSVEDEGQVAKKLADRRDQWCGKSLQFVVSEVEAARASLAFMGTDLAEHEAAMEEVRGTESQVRADIALMAYTLNQTEQMLAARRHAREAEKEWDATNSSLVQIYHKREQSEFVADEQSLLVMADTKRHTLMSLQAELELAVPALSQLEERVAETHRAISDGQQSVKQGTAFLDVLKNGCESRSARDDAQALARVNATGSIQRALEALVHIGTVPMHAISEGSSEDPATQMSFVQLRSGQEDQETEEDLFSIFGGAASSAQTVPEVQASQHIVAHRLHRHAHAQAPHEEASAKRGAGTQQRIERLLTQLKATSRGKLGAHLQPEFCARERTQNKLLLRLAQASTIQMAVEIDVHSDIEEQVKDDLKRLHETSDAIDSIVKAASNGTSKEKATMEGNARNQALATKILAQVLAIMSTVNTAPDLSDASRQAAAEAMVALRSARFCFEAQHASSSAGSRESEEFAGVLAKTGHLALAAFDHERVNLEVTRDSHASERSRNTASKNMYEAEAEDAAKYLKKLEADCSASVIEKTEHEQSAQVKVLQDAQRIMSGQGLPGGQGPSGLRGGAGGQRPAKDLSPMERAAAEMGVSVDGN